MRGQGHALDSHTFCLQENKKIAYIEKDKISGDASKSRLIRLQQSNAKVRRRYR